MRKSNIMQLLKKYGKNYYDAPSSKNMARTIVMRLQAKIWQELLRCAFKQKYGKNYCDAPSNKNMARTITRDCLSLFAKKRCTR